MKQSTERASSSFTLNNHDDFHCDVEGLSSPSFDFDYARDDRPECFSAYTVCGHSTSDRARQGTQFLALRKKSQRNVALAYTHLENAIITFTTTVAKLTTPPHCDTALQYCHPLLRALYDFETMFHQHATTLGLYENLGTNTNGGRRAETCYAAHRLLKVWLTDLEALKTTATSAHAAGSEFIRQFELAWKRTTLDLSSLEIAARTLVADNPDIRTN